MTRCDISDETSRINQPFRPAESVSPRPGRPWVEHRMIRISTSDDKCQECIQNLKQEAQNLKIQDRMLRTGEAVFSSSVKFYHNYEKIIGYVINGIGVVLGTVQLVAGVGLFAGSLFSGNVIGVVAGSALIANGAGSKAESIDNFKRSFESFQSGD